MACTRLAFDEAEFPLGGGGRGVHPPSRLHLLRFASYDRNSRTRTHTETTASCFLLSLILAARISNCLKALLVFGERDSALICPAGCASVCCLCKLMEAGTAYAAAATSGGMRLCSVAGVRVIFVGLYRPPWSFFFAFSHPSTKYNTTGTDGQSFYARRRYASNWIWQKDKRLGLFISI